MDTHKALKRSPLTFFLLVFGLSIPFWILGYLYTDVTRGLPMQLPISALMTFCPGIAAAILVYNKRKAQGLKELLKRIFDFARIRDKKWYIPLVFLMPLIALISYGYMKITGAALPEPSLSIWGVSLFFCIYFVGAIGEELGWSGYVTDPLQSRFGALTASIFLGMVWAMWHIIPWSQTPQTPVWIIWQSIGTVFLRIIMVWLFNHTGKSVFAMILFHTLINISPYLIPDNGAHYDPLIFCLLLLVVVLAIWVFEYKKRGAAFRQPQQP